MAIPCGANPTEIVVVTVFVAVLMTDTVLELKFVTYMYFPSGVATKRNGYKPTGTVATTLLVAALITETAFEPWVATYIVELSGVIAIPEGIEPTGILVTTESVVEFYNSHGVAVGIAYVDEGTIRADSCIKWRCAYRYRRQKKIG